VGLTQNRLITLGKVINTLTCDSNVHRLRRANMQALFPHRIRMLHKLHSLGPRPGAWSAPTLEGSSSVVKIPLLKSYRFPQGGVVLSSIVKDSVGLVNNLNELGGHFKCHRRVIRVLGRELFRGDPACLARHARDVKLDFTRGYQGIIALLENTGAHTNKGVQRRVLEETDRFTCEKNVYQRVIARYSKFTNEKGARPSIHPVME